MSNSLWSYGLQHTSLPCPSLSQSLLRFMSIESVILSNHLILCFPLLLLPSIFPSIRVFSSDLFASSDQSIGAPASVLPMNIQGWFPLGWTGLITLQSKELSRVFSSTQLKGTNSSALSLLCGPTLTFIPADWKNYSFDYTAAFILYQLAWC